MKKITVIGGDSRLKLLKTSLIEAGYTVDTLGLFEDDSADVRSYKLWSFPYPLQRTA